MSTKQTRNLLAAELTKHLPKRKYLIFPNAADRDAIGKPTLILVRDSIQPLPEMSFSAYRANTFQLLVISPRIDDDDFIDDLADEVLDALALIPGAFFSLAQRRTYGESNPAYEITVTFPDDRQNKE